MIMAILAAILVVLKLLGKIHVSWIWVLAPIWIPWVLLLLGYGLVSAAT